jgi:hypothetical protein
MKIKFFYGIDHIKMLEAGATSEPDRNRVYVMLMTSTRDIRVGYTISTIGTQHFSTN